MLVITGFFENGKFVPDNPVSLPEKTRVLIKVEETAEENERQVRIKKWNEIKKAILVCEEELTGEPIPLSNFRTPDEIDLL
jgi:predicted DNA-binding antitoxin AbrB/MazE fold protein